MYTKQDLIKLAANVSKAKNTERPRRIREEAAKIVLDYIGPSAFLDCLIAGSIYKDDPVLVDFLEKQENASI